MKEWQELLEYIDQFVYVKEDEKIIIKHGPKATDAQAAYERGLSVFLNKDTVDIADIADRRVKRYSEMAQWEYDIALDCVRQMKLDDREYVKKHMQTTEYHFGYAMWIRNNYIHPAKKHTHYEADGISSSIMEKIFSILSPVYDFRNGAITGFFNDFSMSHLMELYSDSQPEIFEDVIINLVEGDVYDSSKEAISDLKDKLRAALGPDEFVRIFKKALADYEEKEAKNDREEWYWETNFPACKAVLYPLQAKQMNVLRRMRFFSQVESRSIKSLKECREYIDENLGLRDDYADYMARMAWEVCDPVKTGKWKELSLYQLDVSFSVRWKLEEKGIKTMEKLCECTYEELCEVPGVGIENATKIKDEVEQMGLMLKAK